MFFNTFLFPQVFPQGVWKTIILVLRIADVHWRVPMRSIVGYYVEYRLPFERLSCAHRGWRLV